MYHIEEYDEKSVFMNRINKNGDIVCFLVDKEDVDKIGNKVCWYHMNGKYIQLKVSGKKIMLHRFLIGNLDYNVDIDHKNNNSLDNRRCNLRICSRSENNQNCGKPKNNTSGHKGIILVRKPWTIRFWANGKLKRFGEYKTLDEAIEARNKYYEQVFNREFDRHHMYGVTKSKPYYVRVRVNNKYYYAGHYFDDIEEAVRARDELYQKHHNPDFVSLS